MIPPSKTLALGFLDAGLASAAVAAEPGPARCTTVEVFDPNAMLHTRIGMEVAQTQAIRLTLGPLRSAIVR
jgi:hypothetical protein